MIEIVSPSNPRFKSALKLLERRGRQQQQRFLIDGLRETQYAIRFGIELETLFVNHSTQAESSSAIKELSQACPTAPLALAPALFGKLAYGQRQSHVVAVAKTPKRTFAQIQLAAPALIVVVEGLEKPGNLGAIARTVDAVGADALLLADCAVDPFNPNVVRASMGTALAAHVVPCSSAEAMTWLAQQQINVCTAWVEDSQLYHEIDYRSSVAIVLGSEAQGLSSDWRRDEYQRIRLPMHGIADSLNVSTTAAVLLYEVWRQRHP